MHDPSKRLLVLQVDDDARSRCGSSHNPDREQEGHLLGQVLLVTSRMTFKVSQVFRDC